MAQGKRKLALMTLAWSLALGGAAPARASVAGEPGEPPNRGTLLIRKCVEADGGGVRFQSTPCPVGSAQAWTRSEPMPPAVPSTTHRGGRAGRGGNTPARSGYAVRVANRNSAFSRRGRCESARAEAALKRDRDWNRLKFDDLSQLDAWVAERCR